MTVRTYVEPQKAVTSLVGEVFGRLTVMCLLGSFKNRIYYRCECSCGGTVEVPGASLRYGNTTSCGCISREKTAKRNTSHGKSGTPLYGLWHRMWQRCTDKNCADYQYYVARGITVADTWKDFSVFEQDVGPRPDGMTLDRVDNNLGYQPGNVRWVSRAEQMLNTRYVNNITFNGETHCIAEWERRLGFKPGTVKARLNRLGFSVEKALTTPVRKAK